jgi:Outer membrane protein beta-barrel domain
MEPFKRFFLGCVLIFLCLPASAQQTDINRYTLFTGFDYLVSPARNLTERGFEGDFGVTLKPWLGLGGDFSAMGDAVISGAGTINGSETVFASLLPPGTKVGFRSSTYTFAAGPQFYIRKWDRVTFLVRPGLGGIHEVADIAVPPPFQALVNSHQTDTQLFVGVGAGFDINITRPLGWRFAGDYVNTHLFSNLLVPRQNYWRFSTGPTFRWGHLK